MAIKIFVYSFGEEQSKRLQGKPPQNNSHKNTIKPKKKQKNKNNKQVKSFEKIQCFWGLRY